MAERGTAAPEYISPSKFFAREHGDEHGVERPPAYTTVAPSKTAAAQFIPRAGLGEDAEEIEIDGRQNIPGLR
jgi:hypothetical protein